MTCADADCAPFDHRCANDAAMIAAELILTDALMANDAETLHPDHYIVDAADVEYLVKTVLALAKSAPQAPLRV